MTSESTPALLLLLGAFLLFFILGVIGLIQSARKPTAGWIFMACLGLLGCCGLLAGRIFWVTVAGQVARGPWAHQVTSSDGSMEVKLPSMWSPMPQLNESAELSYGSKATNEYLIILVGSKSNRTSNLAEYFDLLTKNFQATAKSSTAGPMVKLTVDQQPALQRRIAASFDDTDVVYKYTLVEEPEAILQIICWTVPIRESGAFKKFDDVISSFHVKGSLKPKDRPVSQAPAALQVVRSKHKRVQIAVPVDWTEYPGLNPKADLAYGNGSREEYLVIFDDPKSGLPDDMTLEKYQSAISKSNFRSDAVFDDVKSLTIVERPALQQRVAFHGEKASGVFLSTCVEFPMSYLHVLCWTLPSRESAAFPVYDRVLQTLQPAKDNK